MKPHNVIRDKSFAFAVRIVRAFQFIIQEKHEYIMSKQLLRSGTSIGANVEEAIGAQSKKDFIAKLSIAYKEAKECIYWIRLQRATHYLDDPEAKSLIADAEELCRIIASIQISTKRNMSK